MLKYLYICLFIPLMPGISAGQQKLVVAPGIRLPKDSTENRALLKAIDVFLDSTASTRATNAPASPAEQPETWLLLDELKDLRDQSASGAPTDDVICLTNLVRMAPHCYFIQVSYLDAGQSPPVIRATVSFMARKKEDCFLFSSVLPYHTRHWKSTQLPAVTFRYRDSLNLAKALEYDSLIASFDNKLRIRAARTVVYCCENNLEVQALTGISGKPGDSGRLFGRQSAACRQNLLIVAGDSNSTFSNFDPHDLWHERLKLAAAGRKINKAVDEGCAYLYGGSWGMSWQTVFKAFREQIAAAPAMDWARLKEHPVYFRTGPYRNSADYIVNALLVKKIEKERGFEAVRELLQTDSAPAYYQVLEKLTGISVAGYNQAVRKLIAAEP